MKHTYSYITRSGRIIQKLLPVYYDDCAEISFPDEDKMNDSELRFYRALMTRPVPDPRYREYYVE